MKQKIIAGIVVGLLVIAAFYMVFIKNLDNDDVTDETVPSDDNEPSILSNITSYNDAVNDFCFDLFKELKENEVSPLNLFYSPYSVFTALAMAYEGARNNTAAEMKDVLSVEQDNESFHEYMKNLYEYLNENSEYNISTANALWPNIDFELLKDYTNIIETFYGGNNQTVDYSDPEKAAGIINGWVENKTNNLIKDLVPASLIDPVLTRLILTNAIYFKGTWKIQFDKENTTKQDFLNSDGETVSVDTMKRIKTEDEFNFTETDDLKILELEYKGNDLSMMIMLPKEEGLTDLSGIIDSLNQDDYSDWIEQMTKKEVDIYLPKFELETKYTLNGYLQNMGMNDAFNGNADFSGMNDNEDIYISSVLHKAFVEVNEEGTEAAAATALMFGTTSVDDDIQRRIEFKCDQPFLFTIHHKETGTILFMGEVNNLEDLE